jgi:hypothetical protein
MSDEFWLNGTKELLRRCDAAITCHGWQASKGSVGEVLDAEARGQPVFHSVEELEAWLRYEEEK